MTATSRTSTRIIAAMIALLLLAIGVMAWSALSDDSGDGGEGRRGSGAQLFAPKSVWNAPLGPRAALDPRSAQLSEVLRREAEREVAAGTGPWIETDDYTTPLYTVPAGQPTVRVQLSDANAAWRRPLQQAFSAVPIPPRARPASGTDAHLTIWQPATDRLWEFWQAKKSAGGWQASFGGAIQRVSKSPGYYTSSSWPGAGPHWGATATSLPAIGGTIRLEELARGRIDHALAISIPQARAGVFSWPAQRTDGLLESPDAIPEGARFRLDPALDIERLGLAPLTEMMARAAQRHGIVVRDQTGSGGAIGFYVEDTTLKGPAENPFWQRGEPREDGYLGGQSPSELLARFPWDRLELLKTRLCNAAPCPAPGA